MADRFVSEPAGAGGTGRYPESATPTINPQGSLQIRRIRELKFMVPEFVDRTGGSNLLSAPPTGSRWNRALPGGQTSVGVWGSSRQGRRSLAAGRLSLRPLATAGQSTKSGTINWSSRFLRIRRLPCEFSVGIASPVDAGRKCIYPLASHAGRVCKLRWGSGGAVGGADSHLLPRILSSGYALFESLPQPESLRGVSKAEFGSSNLWLPNSSIESAAAGGCRLSLPAP